MSHSVQMHKKQDSVSCATLVFVQDMKKQELYKITHKGEVLFENLTEEEYFNKMQDLADDYFANGTPHPLDLRTEIKEN